MDADDNNPLLDILVRFQRGELDLEAAYNELTARELTVVVPEWCPTCGRAMTQGPN